MDFLEQQLTDPVLKLTRAQFMQIIKSVILVSRKTVNFTEIVSAPELAGQNKKLISFAPVDFLDFLQVQGHYLVDAICKQAGVKFGPNVRAQIYTSINFTDMDSGIKSLEKEFSNISVKFSPEQQVYYPQDNKNYSYKEILARILHIRRSCLVIRLIAVEPIIIDYQTYFDHFAKNPISIEKLTDFDLQIEQVLQKIYSPKTQRVDVPILIRDTLANIGIWPKGVTPSNISTVTGVLQMVAATIKCLIKSNSIYGRINTTEAINLFAHDIAIND